MTQYWTGALCVCVYMTVSVCISMCGVCSSDFIFTWQCSLFICTYVYMTMFICVCVYMTMFFCLSDERVSQLPHCYAWCHRGIRGADKTKQKSHHSPECCPCWAFNQKNLRSTNEEDGVGALLIRTDRNVKMQGPDWPNMRHWWPNNVRSTGSSTIVQREFRHQTHS